MNILVVIIYQWDILYSSHCISYLALQTPLTFV